MTGSAGLSSGGFVGYNLGTVNITDCLCAPGSIGVGMYSFVNDWTGGSTLSRAYRTKDSSNSLNQGIRVYSSVPAGQLNMLPEMFLRYQGRRGDAEHGGREGKIIGTSAKQQAIFRAFAENGLLRFPNQSLFPS